MTESTVDNFNNTLNQFNGTIQYYHNPLYKHMIDDRALCLNESQLEVIDELIIRITECYYPEFHNFYDLVKRLSLS